jgi:hypothetical protein
MASTVPMRRVGVIKMQLIRIGTGIFSVAALGARIRKEYAQAGEG